MKFNSESSCLGLFFVGGLTFVCGKYIFVTLAVSSDRLLETMKRRQGLLENKKEPPAEPVCSHLLRNLLWQYLLWVHTECQIPLYPQVNIISIIEVEKPGRKYLDLVIPKDGVAHPWSHREEVSQLGFEPKTVG